MKILEKFDKELMLDLISDYALTYHKERTIEDLLKNNGYTIPNEIYYSQDKENRRYIHEFHNTDCLSTLEVKINTKISNYNPNVLEDVYNFEWDYYKDTIAEIDKENQISVWTYGGKRFYIGYIVEEYEDIHFYKENREILDKVVNFLRASKDGIEIECMIENFIENTERDYLGGDLRVYLQGHLDYSPDNIRWNDERIMNQIVALSNSLYDMTLKSNAAENLRKNLKKPLNYRAHFTAKRMEA